MHIYVMHRFVVQAFQDPPLCSSTILIQRHPHLTVGYHLSEELTQLLEERLINDLLPGGLAAAPAPFPEDLYSKVN
jgi:hypothetical protein